jgi:hypothetical protein
MKYFDKNTIRNKIKWQSKPEPDFYESWKKNQDKIIKKGLLKFSNKVTDKIWWASLTEKEKRDVYSSYQGHIARLVHYPKDFNSWFDGIVRSLKDRYPGNTQIKRDLKISQILK